jgi:hypothetical protein
MWKNIVEPSRPQTTHSCACALNAGYLRLYKCTQIVLQLIAFPLPQWPRERASVSVPLHLHCPSCYNSQLDCYATICVLHVKHLLMNCVGLVYCGPAGSKRVRDGLKVVGCFPNYCVYCGEIRTNEMNFSK